MDITNEIKIAVSQHRSNLQNLGGQLGSQFFQAQSRECIPEFMQKLQKVKAEGNNDLIVNRSPLRYAMIARDIVNIGVYAGVDGSQNLQINRDSDGVAEITIPLTDDMGSYSKTTEEAIKAALKGDTSKVFSDPRKTAELLNTANNAELARVRSLISTLQKVEQQLNTTIEANRKKVTDFYAQGSKAIQESPDGTTVVVNIHNDNEAQSWQTEYCQRAVVI